MGNCLPSGEDSSTRGRYESGSTQNGTSVKEPAGANAAVVVMSNGVPNPSPPVEVVHVKGNEVSGEKPVGNPPPPQDNSSEHSNDGKPKEEESKEDSNNQKYQKKEKEKENDKEKDKEKEKATDKDDVSIPLGLRTDFGYARDFPKHYLLGKELGHGQFGTTYMATSIQTHEKVAVKRLQKRQMKVPISVDDVRREVKILQLLSGHPNVVQFYDVFEDDEHVFIVMEVCEGGELLDRILSKKDSRYSEKDAAKIVRQMLNVVALCHLNGVVHRDLKPENFLFLSKDEDSLLKATDFGLSDFRRPGKHFTDVVGSAYYVAPEVLKRRSGPESDVWSIGVISYILLSGRRPFWDKTEAGIFNEVLKKRPDFKEKPWMNVSALAKDFLKKLLKKDPHSRPTAAQALSHPWVREGGRASDMPLDILVLSNMREFIKFSRLKQVALGALARTLDEQELQVLRDQFDAMDINKDGTITLDEMRQALNKDVPHEVKESRVLRILQAMDINCDGLVDFHEFVAASLHVQHLEEADFERWQQRSRVAFSIFDTDNDGYIDADELRRATQVKGSIESFMKEADIDGDGRISLSEFQKLLRSASIGSRTNRDYSRSRSRGSNRSR